MTGLAMWDPLPGRLPNVSLREVVSTSEKGCGSSRRARVLDDAPVSWILSGRAARHRLASALPTCRR